MLIIYIYSNTIQEAKIMLKRFQIFTSKGTFSVEQF